jgi:hypothetical protein
MPLEPSTVCQGGDAPFIEPVRREPVELPVLLCSSGPRPQFLYDSIYSRWPIDELWPLERVMNDAQI